ncbi:MAG TPA: aldolase [Alphaproteobacteria bacterium]|jgi:ribulose-5-phosphate 4-epimerase/fuculose-1-phosphate aldolase|nr:aldolase [Alphaproteobacteria bacterium]
MQLVSTVTSSVKPAAAEWQARVDLAAAHRMAVIHGFNEGIFNHFTLAVPGKSDRFYLIPFGLYWSEVAASSFMEVSYDGRLLSGAGEVERSAFCIHAPIHRLSPGAACVLHTHMPYASALTRLEDPHIAAIGQTEAAFLNITAYDQDYTGLAYDPAEGERLSSVLGEKKVLFMANHGVLVVGETVAEAYDRLFYLERACQVQLYAMWTGRPLKPLSDVATARLKEQYSDRYFYGGKSSADHHFDALKRVLDRREPDYRD